MEIPAAEKGAGHLLIQVNGPAVIVQRQVELLQAQVHLRPVLVSLGKTRPKLNGFAVVLNRGVVLFEFEILVAPVQDRSEHLKELLPSR